MPAWPQDCPSPIRESRRRLMTHCVACTGLAANHRGHAVLALCPSRIMGLLHSDLRPHASVRFHAAATPAWCIFNSAATDLAS